MSSYRRQKQKHVGRGEPVTRKQHPLAAVQSLKDRAAVKGYRLSMFRGASGDWEYTIEGMGDRLAKFPAGGSGEWDVMLLAAELAVGEL